MFYALIIVCAMTVPDCDAAAAMWLDESDPVFDDAEVCFGRAEDYIQMFFDDTWPHRTVIICTQQSVAA